MGAKGKGANTGALALPLIRGNTGPNVAQVGGVPQAPLNGQFAAAASLAAQAANLGRGRGSLLTALPNGNGLAMSKPNPSILAGRGRGLPGSVVQSHQQPVRSLVEEDIHTKLLGL